MSKIIIVMCACAAMATVTARDELVVARGAAPEGVRAGQPEGSRGLRLGKVKRWTLTFMVRAQRGGARTQKWQTVVIARTLWGARTVGNSRCERLFAERGFDACKFSNASASDSN